MTTKGLGWKFLAVVFAAALLTSGTWVKAADAARLTHHQATVKDGMGKALGKTHCVVYGSDGNFIATVVTSVEGLISFIAHPEASLRCIKDRKLYVGKAKAGRKVIVTKKQELKACYLYDLIPFPGNEVGCKADHNCSWHGSLFGGHCSN